MESATDVGNECRKALFTSPGVYLNEKAEQTDKTASNMLEIEREIDVAYKNTQRDCHEKRMKKFRKMAKRLSEDDWMYPSIEKLIGLK